MRSTAQIMSASALASLAFPAAQAADTCTESESQSLRDSLHYKDPAPDSKQSCGACAFFSEEDAKQSCGNCMIMSGRVSRSGHCDSWSMKG
jgi:hypothetical protein